RLWMAYSQGRFGFSVQARLLAALGGRYDRLWPRIGWKVDEVWTRYPTAFNWSIQAPEGHMPLTNQLRGVRLIDALLSHPALLERREASAKG
ncbi:MAG: GUN4 domain-containing protein, partial [Prochlorococcus sp.]